MISPHARIWIYQTNRILNQSEVDRIQQRLDTFTGQWQAHGASLHALGEVLHNQFIILSVDEVMAGATGCSIDKSVYLMKEIEEDFDLNLFDRFRIAYRDGNEVKNCSREEFENLITEGKIGNETKVFNNLIQSRYQLDNAWEVPFKDSWHAKVFVRPV